MPDHFKETPSVTAEFPAGNFTFVISYFVFCKKDIPTNFTKLTGKHLCQSLFFNTSWRLRAPALLKKRLWHICFPLNFKKILGLPFLHNTSKELLLKMGSFQKIAVLQSIKLIIWSKSLKNISEEVQFS